jgi:beta propeller repeat protein
MCRSVLLPAAALAVLCGCSCQGGSPAQRDAAADRQVVQYDGGPKDGTPSDVIGDTAGHPEEDWAAALDVPWGPDGTRQLAPIEIPPVGTFAECGSACRQVTSLPGFRACSLLGGRFSVDGDFLTTVLGFPAQDSTRCVQAYVDLRTLKAYGFGAMFGGPSSTTCGAGVVNAGRIAYGCLGSRTSNEARSEVRLFDVATGTERLIWSANGMAYLDLPDSLAFADSQLAEIMSPTCIGSCGALLVSPLAGGARQQVFPAGAQSVGGITALVGSYPYVVFTDMQRYGGFEVVGIDLTHPETVINISNQPSDQWEPRMSGTRVVWTDTRNDPSHGYYDQQNSDIYAKDIASSQEWAVCTDPAQQDSPDIEGDLVAWLDYRNASNTMPGNLTGPQEPYVKNLTDGAETRLEAGSFDARDNLRINQQRVFFHAGSYGVPGQIYMIDLRQAGVVP